MSQLKIFCADVGSIASNSFGWSGEAYGTRQVPSGNNPSSLVTSVLAHLNKGRKVALGFECPLFIPVREKVEEICRARPGEGNRPWNAAAGAAVLATGLAQVTWTLTQIRKSLKRTAPAYLSWAKFARAEAGLFIWEAFVTNKIKREQRTHIEDAAAAVKAFRASLPNPDRVSIIQREEVLSLVGAALLRTGWTRGTSILSEPCITIRPTGGKAAGGAPNSAAAVGRLASSSAAEVQPTLAGRGESRLNR